MPETATVEEIRSAIAEEGSDDNTNEQKGEKEHKQSDLVVEILTRLTDTIWDRLNLASDGR